MLSPWQIDNHGVSAQPPGYQLTIWDTPVSICQAPSDQGSTLMKDCLGSPVNASNIVFIDAAY